MINSIRAIANTQYNTSAALDTLKTLFNMPYIGLPTNSNISVAWAQSLLSSLATAGLFRGLPIYATKCVETARNNIGTQIVIKSARIGEKVTSAITDNIAPMPREYQIEGYIRGVSGVNSLGNVAGVYPVPVKAGINDLAANAMLLKLFKQYLRYVRNTRTPFTFTSAEGEQMSALIEELEMQDLPEVSNAVTVKLKIKEYVTLRVGDVGTNRLTTQTGNLPTVGSIFNSPTQIMSVLSTQLFGLTAWTGTLVLRDAADTISTASATLADTITLIVNTDGTYSDEDGNTVVVQGSTLITIYSEDTLGALTETYGITASQLYALVQGTQFTNVSVASAALAPMQYIGDNGNTQYSEHFNVIITFGGVSVTFTLRKNQYDAKWFITEEGTVNGATVFHSHGVVFNTVQHLNDEFSYVMLSEYVMYNEGTTFEDLTSAQQDACLAGATFLLMR